MWCSDQVVRETIYLYKHIKCQVEVGTYNWVR